MKAYQMDAWLPANVSEKIAAIRGSLEEENMMLASICVAGALLIGTFILVVYFDQHDDFWK